MTAFSVSRPSIFTIVLAGFLFFAHRADAQFGFERDQDVKVFVNDFQLPNAWVGGLTAVQTSMIDVNFDGRKDIYLFDRDGNKSMIFLNEDDTPGAMSYRYAPEYTSQFPNMRDWVLLRDFDGDGKEDIFTGFQSSIAVFRNVSTPEDGLAFELYSQMLTAEFDFGNGPSTFPVVCLSIDIPSIVDYDGDGDLDIITFTESTTTLYLFKNMAVENGTPDELDFVCANRCYGMLAEGSEDNTVFYGEDFQCPFNVLDPRGKEETGSLRHAGGTLLSVDLDGNGILDLIAGDAGFNNMQAWLMTESVNGLDSTYAADLNFPSEIAGTEPVDLYRFPASFYEDVNNDGVRDLIVSPNSRFQADDDNGVWLYLNNGGNVAPEFEFFQPNFLQGGMIEHGTGAYPVLFDYDNDGLLDLFVSNREYFISSETRLSQIALYRNTGTADEPEFTLIDNDWLNLSEMGYLSIYPTFGDIDGDGKADLIIGEESGEIHFFKNIAPVGEPAQFELTEESMQNAFGEVIDIGQFSTPQLFDVDGDGLLDLLIGEKVGIVNYFRNTGSANNYAFTQVEGEAGEAFGGVTVNNLLGINGYSVPHMYRDADGGLHLFVANEIGGIELYNQIDNNLSGLFNQVTDDLQGISEGNRAAMCLGDVNNNGYPDMFYGLGSGGLIFFKGIDPDDVGVDGVVDRIEMKVFPNPASDYVTAEFPEEFGGEVSLYNLHGRLVLREQLRPSRRQVVNVSALTRGWYIMEFVDGSTRKVARLILQ